MLFRRSAAVLALLVMSCLAQTANKVVEPDAIGVVFNLDPTSQELKRLPNEPWKKHQSTGFNKVTTFIRVNGPASSLRLAGGDKALFVFAGAGEEVMKVKMYACVVKDGRREFEFGQARGRNVTYNVAVATTTAKYGSSSYKLTADQSLSPGEYFIAFGSNIFTFGVDAATK